MRITYDKKSDIAYIYLVGKIQDGSIGETVPTSGNHVYLDYVKDRLVGMEILCARKHLAPKLLKQAEPLGETEC